MTSPHVIRQELTYEAPATHRVDDKEFVGLFKAADATPSVLNLKRFMAGNTGANNIDYFDDGFDGKEISILGDGFSLVKHVSSKIRTNTGADKTLAAGKVYRFTRFTIGTDKVWVEDA